MNKNQLLGSSVLVALLSICGLQACNQGATMTEFRSTPSHVSEMNVPTLQPIELPQPNLKGTVTLEEALAERRSVREFTGDPLTVEELSQLLWATQGITDPQGYRTAPSAGALYPLEVYVITSEGIYHYDPSRHRLTLHQPGDFRPGLHAVALRQGPVLTAPVVFVITAVYERTEAKYGKERSPRYVHLEAGHAAQNLLLQAVALDLGAVPIGAFIDEKVKEALALPYNHQPIYVIPVGRSD